MYGTLFCWRSQTLNSTSHGYGYTGLHTHTCHLIWLPFKKKIIAIFRIRGHFRSQFFRRHCSSDLLILYLWPKKIRRLFAPFPEVDLHFNGSMHESCTSVSSSPLMGAVKCSHIHIQYYLLSSLKLADLSLVSHRVPNYKCPVKLGLTLTDAWTLTDSWEAWMPQICLVP